MEAGESGVTYTLFADDSYKICDTLMDKTNAYAYNSSSSMPYIRIDDGGIPIGGGA